MATVLVVDDEPIVREVVVRYLARDGHDTVEAGDGNAARQLIESADPDIVVLDVMLPGTDGLELCRWIRGRSELPVIMLTARGEEADRIVGLELGADDYVTKPFSPRELVARVRSVLRRAALRRMQPSTRSPSATSSSTRETREVRKAGSRIRLTAKEFDLLWFLASHPRRVFSRDQLMASVWGYDGGARHRHRHGPHAPPAREDRGRSVAAAVPPDGLGRRLPVRAVIAMLGTRRSSRWPRWQSASRSPTSCACSRPCGCSSPASPSSPSAPARGGARSPAG